MQAQVPCCCFVPILVHFTRLPRVKLTFPTLAIDVNVRIDPQFSVFFFLSSVNSNNLVVSILLCDCGKVTAS